MRTKVDADGDELRGIKDGALIQLGRTSVSQPSVLEATSLVSYQRRSLRAASKRFLCPSVRQR